MFRSSPSTPFLGWLGALRSNTRRTPTTAPPPPGGRGQTDPRGHRNGLLAGRFDVERDPALTLDLLHAIVEEPRQQHVAQPHLQLRRLEMRIPRADRAMLVVE